MKKIILPILLLCLTLGCGKPIDFSNSRYAEFASAADIGPNTMQKLGFRGHSPDVYFPLPESAKNICICEESSRDMSLWWAFDVSDSDFQEIEKITSGKDQCPDNPTKHDTSFWIPKGTVIKGVRQRDEMKWIGVDPKTKRVYCYVYTM